MKIAAQETPLTPEVISFPVEAARLGYAPGAAYVARRRGTFPVRVCLIGKKLVCFQTDHDEYIRTRESQAHLSVPPIKPLPRVKSGRPTKREELEAKRRGLSIKELRAQQSIVGV